MIYTVILFAMGTFASIDRDIVPFWVEYNSLEGRSKSTDQTIWWDKYITKTTQAWWNNYTKKSADASTPALAKRFVPQNLSLSPRQALELVHDTVKLNKTISEQTEKMFGQDTPELHELVTMWFFMLVNRTRVQVSRNTPYVTHQFTSSSTTEPTWHLTKPAWMVSNGEDEHTEAAVTEHADLSAGQKDWNTGQMDLGTGQPGLGTGSNYMITGPAHDDTGQVDLNTGPAHYVTEQADLGTGPTHYDTEQADLNTGPTDGTGLVNLDTGPAHYGTEQADLGTGPAHYDTEQADLNTGPTDGTELVDLDTGPTHDGTGQVDLDTGPTHDGTGQVDLDTGPAHDGTGQADLDTGQATLDTGPAHDGTGQGDLDTGAAHDGTGQADLDTGQANLDTGPTHDGTGQVDLDTGAAHDGTGQTGLDTGPAHVDTGQAGFETGTAHDGTGQAGLDTGPAHVDTAQAGFETGTAHDGTGQAGLDTGMAHVDTAQAGIETGTAHDGTGQAGLDTGMAHVDTAQAGVETGTAHDGTGQAGLDTGMAHVDTAQAGIETGTAHDGTGQAGLDTGMAHVDTAQAGFETGTAHEPHQEIWKVDLNHAGIAQADLGTGHDHIGTGQAGLGIAGADYANSGSAYVKDVVMGSTGTQDTDIDDTTTTRDPRLSKYKPYYTFIETNKVPDLRYIGGRGKARPKRPWHPGPPDTYKYNNGGLRQLMFTPSVMTPGSQGQTPSPQGPPFPQAPTRPPIKLPFVITQQPIGESPSTVTTAAPTEARTEVSTRGMPAAGPYPDYHDLLERPDYDSMAGYIGRPQLVNEATTLLVLLGVVSSTTTTENPLVVELKREMSDLTNGFFYTFLKKMLELLGTMEKEQAGYLFAATDIILNDMDSAGSLRYLGQPLQPAMLRASSALAASPPEVAQSRALLAYTMLSERSVVPADFNAILNIMDSMYHASEGAALFASLVIMQDYPENNFTSKQVMQTVINASLAPFQRQKGTQRLNTILFKLNTMLEQRFPFRRLHERAQRAGLTSHFRTRTKSHWTVKRYTERTKLKGLTPKTANRYRHTTLAGKFGGPTNNVDVIDLMKNKIKRLKPQGMSIETDRYYTLDKHKHKTHTKKSVKRIIKDHLKNKHPKLYENIKHKYIKAKERNKKANEALFDGVFKNRFSNFKSIPIDKGIDRKKETSEKIARNETQTRFNIVDTLPVFDNENGMHKNKINTDKPKTDISKYLSKYKLKTKQHKQIVEKKRAKIMGEDSLSSDDEKELKFNLQDTIRHGDRKFAERRNYKIRNKNVIHDMSSYSDEEGILKNNIYKVFGYTQRFH